MTCDLLNMLRHAADAAERGDDGYGAYGHALRTLGENLRELHDRHRAGDGKVLDEFFALYIVHSRPAKESR